LKDRTRGNWIVYGPPENSNGFWDGTTGFYWMLESGQLPRDPIGKFEYTGQKQLEKSDGSFASSYETKTGEWAMVSDSVRNDYKTIDDTGSFSEFNEILRTWTVKEIISENSEDLMPFGTIMAPTFKNYPFDYELCTREYKAEARVF
jgi:hypothetical protein